MSLNLRNSILVMHGKVVNGAGIDYYSKSEVMNMFVKSNDLTAYVLTFVGNNGKVITLTETVDQNPVSYTFTMPETGTYTDIFFFHKNDLLSLTVNGVVSPMTLALSNYIETYFIEVPLPLVPAMTGYTTPSGTASASGNSPFPAWNAFNQVANSFWAHDGGMPNAYLQYEWDPGVKVTPSYIDLHPLTASADATIVVKALLWDDVNNTWVDGSDNTTLQTNSNVKWNNENSCNGRININNPISTNKVRILWISTTYSTNANAGGVQIYGLED